MITPGTLSYGLAAAAFLALTVMLLTRWRLQFHGSMLLPASFMSFVWSVAARLGGGAPDAFAGRPVLLLRDAAATSSGWWS